MTFAASRFFRFVALSVLLLCAMPSLGCNGLFGPRKPHLPNIHPVAEERQEEAIRDYDESRNEAEYAAALASAEHGDLSTCRLTLEKILKRDPKHLPSRLLLADVELARENTAAAEKILRDSLVDHPQNAAAHHALGLLLEASNRSAEANVHLAFAAKAEPTNELFQMTRPGNIGNDVAVVNASAIDDSGKIASAGFSQASAPPASVDSTISGVASAAITPAAREAILAADRSLQSGDAASAQAAWHRALELEPNNPQIPLTLSIYLIRHGRVGDAHSILTNSVKRHPQNSSLVRALGALHLQQGDRRAAEVALRQALSLDKNDALSYFLLGHVLSGLGQHEEAAACVKQAHQLDGRYPGTLAAQ